MYEAYFTKRLLKALTLADEAADPDERSVHLQASRYYRDLLQLPEKRVSIRHPTSIPAMLRFGTSLKRVIVCDLSTGGFRVALTDRLPSGTRLELQMDGFAPIDGRVVWQDGDQLGGRFGRPLHPALVDAALAIGGEP